MPTKYTRTPVASFGPALFETLIRASRERIELEFPTWNLGVRFQQRIHMLRAAMLRENHDQYLIVSRVRTSLLWGTKAGYPVEESQKAKNTVMPKNKLAPSKLILQPQDSEFEDVIRAAGIEMTPLAGAGAQLPPRPPPNEKFKVGEANLTLDEILDSIKDN